MEQVVKSDEEIRAVLRARGGIWRWIRLVRRRRPLFTAIIVLTAPAYTLLVGAEPYDLLVPTRSWRFLVPWLLVICGMVIRLWGSGNLRKNQEITETGVYRLVRHPLYFGSLSFFLAYFLTACDPVVGVLLFGTLVALVYYPTMLSEEQFLIIKFPRQFQLYEPPPRLIPDLRRVPEAFRTDRFNIRAAYGNLGFRGFWFVIALPLVIRLIAWAQQALPR